MRDWHISSLICKCWYTSTNIYLIHNCLQQWSGTCNSRFTVRKMLFFKQQFFSLVLFLFYVHICQVNTCVNRIDVHVTEMLQWSFSCEINSCSYHCIGWACTILNVEIKKTQQGCFFTYWYTMSKVLTNYVWLLWWLLNRYTSLNSPINKYFKEFLSSMHVFMISFFKYGPCTCRDIKATTSDCKILLFAFKPLQ